MRVTALALLAVVGCGHSKSATTTTHSSTTPKTSRAAPPRDREPHGRLTAAEFRSIVLEYTLLKPLTSGTDPGDGRRGRAACGAAARPNTRLMELVRKDCLNAVEFFKSIRAVENGTSVCTQGDELVRDRCFAERYNRLSGAMRLTVSNALAINKELERRGIGGLCARSIGIPRSQVVSMTAAAVAAEAAAEAATRQDDAAFLRAQHLLSDALARQPSGDPLDGIKSSCPHEGASKPTPLPQRKRRRRAVPQNPTPAPRIPRPGEGINA